MAMRGRLRGWKATFAKLAAISFLALGNAASSSDFFVRNLPGQPPDSHVVMHAGHITVDERNNGALFFWHFANKHIADRPRTVIWLNGGPGCSSEDGALMEIGPFRVSGDHLVENEGSWNEFANLLFVDQPVGTGFSYVNTDSYLHELPQMAEQFVAFLEQWVETFPEYRDDDLYIAGESYAGQHIPYIATEILKHNAEHGNHFKLKGLLIGNGWIDPLNQYPAYVSYAYDAGLLEKGSDKANVVENQFAECRKAIAEGIHISIDTCEDVLNTILRVTRDEHSSQGCINMYDVRLRDSYPSCGMNWPPDLKDLTPYLRRDDVVRALNIDTEKKRTGWTECAGAVSGNFRARNSAPAVTLLPSLLEQVPILLFSGEKDLICNHLGTEDMIHQMIWKNGTGFEDPPGSGTWAPRQPWVFDNEPAGFYQSARNLTYVLFYNSSHMVPFDYARRTRDMLDRFVGVDISHVGGQDGESKVGGETNRPPTSVDETTKQSEETEEQEKQKVKEATWRAYYRAGALALVFVIIAALALGYVVYKQRRKEGAKSLRDVFMGKLGRQNRQVRLEEGLGDENELDELVTDDDHDDPMFSLSDDEETDEEHGQRRRVDVETGRFVNDDSNKRNLED